MKIFKYFMSLIIVCIFSSYFILNISAAEPVISITRDKNTVTVSEGSSFSLTLRFSLDSGDRSSLDSWNFNISDLGGLSLASGSDYIEDFNFGQNYQFNFQVPSGMSGQSIVLPLAVDYTFRDGGNLKNKTTNSNLTITIISGGSGGLGDGNYLSGSIKIENINAESVSVGAKATIEADVMNDTLYDISSVKLTINGGKKPISHNIGYISAGSEAKIEITLDPFDSEGTKNLTMKLDYRSHNNVGRSMEKKFSIQVLKGIPITISDLEYSDSISINETAEFSLKLINRNDTEYKNAEVALYKEGRLLGSRYIGKIEPQAATNVTFNHTFTEGGKANYTFIVVYQSNLVSMQATKQFTLDIKSAGELQILNIIIPDDISLGQISNINFDVVNKTSNPFSNAESFITKDGVNIARKYIGKIEQESSESVVMSHVFKQAGRYSLVLTSTDVNGEIKKTEKQINIVPSGGSGRNNLGIIRIQSIQPPIEAEKKTKIDVKIALTNPSSEPITGADLAIFNTAGKEVDSLYISSIEPYSMSDHTLNFVTGNQIRNESYRVKLTYKNLTGATETITRNFSVAVVENIEEEEDKDEKPAQIKIQKLEVPQVAYTNVRTKVPFTLVNSGKGIAYNVEVYVLDDDNGEELAREYIGNIQEAHATSELSFHSKVAYTGDINATFYVTYENFDDSRHRVRKSYTQKIIDYRASIIDIDGIDIIVTGTPSTIEFGVQNSGTEKMLNTQAYLTDSYGTNYSEIFIGTIEPGTKAERQRFRNITFMSEGDTTLVIRVTYENQDMQLFEFQIERGVFIQGNYDPFSPMPDDPGYDVNEETPTDEAQSVAWWIWAIIAGGLAVIAVVIIIVISVKRKKKKAVEHEEDINFLLSQIAVGASDLPNNEEAAPDFLNIKSSSPESEASDVYK